MLTLTGAAQAADGRGVSYGEVLTTVAEQHPLVTGAAGAQMAAEGALLEARGIFDPLWRTQALWKASRERQFLPYQFEATQRAWDLYSGFEGVTPLGTTWSIGAGLDHLYSRSVSTETDLAGIPVQSDVTQRTYGSRVFASLSQELLRGTALAYNLQAVRSSRETADAAGHLSEASRQDALAGAATAYWTWVQASGEATIAADALAAAEQGLVVARSAAEQGGVARAYVSRLEAAAAAARSDASQARVLAGQAEDQVRAWLGEGPGESWVPTTPPGDATASSLDPLAVAAAVKEASPALAAARSEAAAARAVERGAHRARLPSLTATGVAGVAARDATASAATAGLLDSDNLPYIEIGGVLLVPIGNRTGRGTQMRAEGDLAVAEANVAALERESEAQAIAMVRAMAAAQDQIAQADTRVRAQSEALAAEEAALAQGGSHPQFVLDQRQAVVDAQVEALAARTRWRLALTELQRLQGTLGTDLP